MQSLPRFEATTPLHGCALTIAGSDSSGGAGIQADLKTFAAFTTYGASVITAVTAQNTVAVRAIHQLPDDAIEAQIEAVLDDINIGAIKIGMLGTASAARRVASVLARRARDIPIVLDPVLIATSGDALAEEGLHRAIIEVLLPLMSLVTPNGPEAAVLCGFEIDSVVAQQKAGEKLRGLGAKAVLVKGGHVPGKVVSDVLVSTDGVDIIANERLHLGEHHGSGCTLSAAITARLAQGYTMGDAVAHGIAFVRAALQSAPSIGHGARPLNHAVTPCKDI